MMTSGSLRSRRDGGRCIKVACEMFDCLIACDTVLLCGRGKLGRNWMGYHPGACRQ